MATKYLILTDLRTKDLVYLASEPAPDVIEPSTRPTLPEVDAGSTYTTVGSALKYGIGTPSMNVVVVAEHPAEVMARFETAQAIGEADTQ